MKRILRIVVAVLAFLVPGGASAAYLCSVSSAGFSTVYTAANPATNITQTSLTVSCSRDSGDSASMAYAVAANNGANALGANNRAALSGTFVRYDVYKDAGCGTQWKGSNTLTGTLNFGTGNSASVTVPYWGCVGASQMGLLAGTYMDTVAMTLSYGPNPQLTASGSLQVAISTVANCTVSAAPGNIMFTYVAFGAAANDTRPFGVTCTNGLAYTLGLDATSGTIIGLNYTLTLSNPTAVGSGLQQNFSISGNMPAGQAGICATGTCNASQARTLTISY